MSYWLMKSEPGEFSIDDLEATPEQTEPWDGVRNYQARNMMRDEMKVGDLAFFYHSNCAVPGVVGIMKIVREGYDEVSERAERFVRFPPGYVEPRHEHDHYHSIFVLEGEMHVDGKVLKPGERKVYYEAEKDVMEMMKQIILNRKRRELDPMVKVLDEISIVESHCKESAEFCRMVRELKEFSHKADQTLENICTSKSNWLYQALLRTMS